MENARFAELSFAATIKFALLALFGLLLVGLWVGHATLIVAALVACAAAYVAQLADTFAHLNAAREEPYGGWMVLAWCMWAVSLLAWLTGLIVLIPLL